GFAHREGSLPGLRAAPLEQTGDALVRLGAVAGLALGGANRLLGGGAGGAGGAAALERSLDRRTRPVLGARGTLDLGDQTVTLVAAGEHQLAAALRELPDLAPRAEPHPPAAGRGDAAEVVGQVLQALDHPGIGEQP